MGTKPEWCTWWSDREWSRFERLLKVTDRFGVLTDGARDGAADPALRTVAEAVRDAPGGKWSATIADLVKQRGVDNQAPGEDQVAAPSWLSHEQAASLRIQLVVRDEPDGEFRGIELPPDPLVRPLGGGLHEVLQLLKDGTVETPDRSFFESWGNPDALFAAARANLKTESIRKDHDETNDIYTLYRAGNDLVAAQVTLLIAHTMHGSGHLVMVPDRHHLLCHEIGSGGQGFNSTLMALLAAGHKIHTDAVNPLSDQLFWWRAGKLTVIPTRYRGGKFDVDVPQELREVVRTLAAEPAPDLPEGMVEAPKTAKELERILRIHVMRKDALEFDSTRVTRSIGADLVEVLVFHLGDKVGIANWPLLESYGANVDAMFEIARANVRAEPVLREEIDLGGATVYFLGSNDSTFVASQLLLLDEVAAASPYGYLVMLPNTMTMVYHPIHSAEHLMRAFGMVPLARRLMREGWRESQDIFDISDNLYWWRKGKLTEIPASMSDGEVTIDPPTPFLEMARALGF